MKAAVAGEFRQALVIGDRPIPSSGRGHVTVQMEASGLYRTDIARA
jgi:D-arabinose 1-dehydrogenase-like Zn-dependent alcohol dehydrogenase